MPRPGARDPVKERHWRRVFAKWRVTGLSGAEYCRRNEVSYIQFIDWQKKLRRRNTDAEQAAIAAREKIQGAARPDVLNDKRAQGKSEAQFVPVQITGGKSLPESCPDLEIVFESGIVLRLNSGCSLEFISGVITLLEKR